MDYCSTIIIDATMEQKNRLQRLQNTCVRYICGVNRTDHVTAFRSKLSWLRADTRRQCFTAVLLYKTVENIHVILYSAQVPCERNLRVQVPMRELEIQTASDTCKFPLPSLYVTKKVRRATASAALLSLSLSSLVCRTGNNSHMARGSAVVK